MPVEAIDAAARNRDRSPAVRAADQILRVDVLLIADVQVVAQSHAGERQVVADLAGVAEEVVLVELAAEADESAARQVPATPFARPACRKP